MPKRQSDASATATAPRRSRRGAPTPMSALDLNHGDASPRTISPPPEEIGDDGLSAYERERLANIARNNAKLDELGLLDTAAQMRPAPKAAKPTSRGLIAKRQKTRAPAAPPRRSGRVANVAATHAGGIASEKMDGTVTLATGEVVPRGGRADAYDEPRERHPPDEMLPAKSQLTRAAEKEISAIDKQSEHMMPETKAAKADKLATERAEAEEAVADAKKNDEAALAVLVGGQKAKGGDGKKGISALVGELSRLDLDEGDVAKVTKNATVHLKFQARADTLMLGCGDKDGNVSLWHIDRREPSPSDGVFMFAPHRQYVAGLAWSATDSSVLYSASYDGSVRALRAERCAFEKIFSSEEIEISAMAVGADGDASLWIGDNDGKIRAIDPRAKCAAKPALAAHAPSKVNMLSLCPGRQHLLASAGGDSAVRVWDVRALTRKKPLVELNYTRGSQGAEWAPDGSGSLLTTCYDDRLRVYARLADNPNADAKPVSIKHNCHTGRWVVPFRATWTAASDGVLVGGMNRTAEVYSAAGGARVASMSSEFMTAIPSRNAAHSSVHAIACATNSGRIHIYR